MNRKGACRRLSCAHETACVEGLEGRLALSAAVWTGAGGNALWSNPANWSGGAVPGAASDVVIGMAGMATVIADAGPIRVRSLDLEDRLIVNRGVSLSVAGEMNVRPASDLRINGLVNWVAGQWQEGAGVRVQPGGRLNIGSSQHPDQGEVTLSTLLVNDARLAWRGGDISLSPSGEILNQQAKGFDIASPLAITGPGTVTNYGLIRRGGQATQTTTIDTVFHNADRVFVLRGTLQLGTGRDHSTMIGFGTFWTQQASSSVVFRIPAQHRDGSAFTGNGRYEFQQRSQVFSDNIYFANATVFQGSDVWIDPGGARLGGTIALLDTHLEIEGTLSVAGDVTLTRTTSAGQAKQIQILGTLGLDDASLGNDVLVRNAGTLYLAGDSAVQGRLENFGTLDLGQSTLSVASAPERVGLLTNAGTLLLGASAGLSVDGDFLTTGAVDVAMTSAGISQISVTGTSTLSGTLRVHFVGGGFQAVVRNFLTSGQTRVGTFDDFDRVGLPSGLQASLVYTAGAVGVRLR